MVNRKDYACSIDVDDYECGGLSPRSSYAEVLPWTYGHGSNLFLYHTEVLSTFVNKKRQLIDIASNAENLKFFFNGFLFESGN